MIVPGIAGMSVMSTTFTALAYNLTFLREQRDPQARCAARRCRPRAYLAGIAGNAVTNTVLQIVDRHRRRPRCCSGSTGRSDWLALCVFVVVGVVCFAVARRRALARDPELRRPRPPTSTRSFLPMIFISGVFYDDERRAGGSSATSPRRCRSST